MCKMTQVLISRQIIVFSYFNKKNDKRCQVLWHNHTLKHSPKHTPTLTNSDPTQEHSPHQGIEPGPHHTVAHVATKIPLFCRIKNTIYASVQKRSSILVSACYDSAIEGRIKFRSLDWKDFSSKARRRAPKLNCLLCTFQSKFS